MIFSPARRTDMKGLYCLIFVPFLLSVANGICDGDWKSFRDSCYLFVNQFEDWGDAEEDCRRRGAWLVDIADEKENGFVHSNLHDYWNWHHIGLTDRDREGTFKWVTGNSMEYENFWPGEPNNSGNNEDCAEMRYHGQWNDVSCSKTQYYICERESEIAPKIEFGTSTTTEEPLDC